MKLCTQSERSSELSSAEKVFARRPAASESAMTFFHACIGEGRYHTLRRRRLLSKATAADTETKKGVGALLSAASDSNFVR